MMPATSSTAMCLSRRDMSRINPTDRSEPTKAATISVQLDTMPKAPMKEDHRQRNHHLGARGDAQHKGACDGIGKEGLQQEARKAQRAAQQRRHQDARKADLPDDASPAWDRRFWRR